VRGPAKSFPFAVDRGFAAGIAGGDEVPTSGRCRCQVKSCHYIFRQIGVLSQSGMSSGGVCNQSPPPDCWQVRKNGQCATPPASGTLEPRFPSRLASHDWTSHRVKGTTVRSPEQPASYTEFSVRFSV
jgi:hypothetical protein